MILALKLPYNIIIPRIFKKSIPPFSVSGAYFYELYEVLSDRNLRHFRQKSQRVGGFYVFYLNKVLIYDKIKKSYLEILKSIKT